MQRRLKLDENTYLILLAVVVGVLGGLGNVGFRYSVRLVEHLVQGYGGGLLGLSTDKPALYLLPLLPAAGAVLLIPLALLFPGQIYGYGLPRFLEQVNLRGAILKRRLILPKLLAAAATIGSGGSAGVEGPIAQLGGGLGSLVGQFRKSSAARMRVLVASGAGAAIAATFNAPITGVLFAVEIVLQGDYHQQSLIALVVAAGVATVISRAFLGAHHAFHVPIYQLANPRELLFYIALGICAGILAAAFIKIFYAVRDLFECLAIPHHLKPVVGALLMGACAIPLPYVMGNGYEFVQRALDGSLVWWLMLALAGAKVVATALTIGSGGVGGTFAPSLYIGAMLGGGFGAVVHQLFPATTAGAGAYAMVGMGAFLAATTQAPLTAAFLLVELTASYMIALPIMFSMTTAVLIARWLGVSSIDDVELERRGINLRAGKEASILRGVSIAEVMGRDFDVIPENAPLRRILALIGQSRHQYFPVVDERGRMTGAVTFQALREILFEEGLKELVVAKDVAVDTPACLLPSDTLEKAVELLAMRDVPALPVVADRESRQVIGLVKRDDVLAAYNSRVLLRYGEGAAT